MAAKQKVKRSYGGRVELHRGKAGYWLRIISSNGKIVANTETYTRKANAVKALASIRKIVMSNVNPVEIKE